MQLLKSISIFLILTIYLGAQNFGRLEEPGADTEETPAISLEKTERAIALEEVVDPDKYILGPGDEIGVNILANEALTFPLRVTPTGDLFIPGVGVCHVAGKTISEAMITVQDFVREYAFPGTQTYLALLEPRFFKTPVSGAVVKPGFVIVTPLTRLSDAIDQVDGFHQLAKEHDVSITHKDGSTEKVNYHQYLLEGKLSSNPTLREGDHIRVPFGEVSKNGIVVRGSITGAGYDIISPNESLGDYIRRNVVFQKNADLQNITLSRTINSAIKHMVILPNDFEGTILEPQDEINFMWERGVMVNGFVQIPGGFSYFPGYSVADYISLSGGNAINGDPRRVYVIHKNGEKEYGDDVTVMRGDVIYVPRSRKDAFIGSSSLLQVVVALTTVYLTYLATT